MRVNFLQLGLVGQGLIGRGDRRFEIRLRRLDNSDQQC